MWTIVVENTIYFCDGERHKDQLIELFRLIGQVYELRYN